MQISSIANVNFGNFSWKARQNETESDTDRRIENSLSDMEMNEVNNVIDRITSPSEKSRKNLRRIDLIDVQFDIKKSSHRGNGHYLIVETTPTESDMDEINAHLEHYDTPKDEYLRRYNVEILPEDKYPDKHNGSLAERVAGFIDKQIRYIHYCTKDPFHNAKRINKH